MVIETARLRLEPWRAEHGAMLARLAAMPDVMRHIGLGATWPAARADEESERVLAHWREHDCGWRAAIVRASGRGVGFMAIDVADGTVPGLAAGEHEIGWWLDPAVWGMGLAAEGGRAVRDEAFVRLGAPAVVARIQPANAASARVAAALGLEPAEHTTGRHGEAVRLHRLDAATWRARG